MMMKNSAQGEWHMVWCDISNVCTHFYDNFSYLLVFHLRHSIQLSLRSLSCGAAQKSLGFTAITAAAAQQHTHFGWLTEHRYCSFARAPSPTLFIIISATSAHTDMREREREIQDTMHGQSVGFFSLSHSLCKECRVPRKRFLHHIQWEWKQVSKRRERKEGDERNIFLIQNSPCV
jgi:hypothetical protein